VFVVPIDRRKDYLFHTKEGRIQPMERVDSDRICLIQLCSDEHYGTNAELREELQVFAYYLRPKNCHDETVQVLTVQENYEERHTIAEGISDMNGPWEVQQIRMNGTAHRRFIFLNSASIIQSEVSITDNFDEPAATVLDLERLSCEHHKMMLGAISMLEQFDIRRKIDEMDVKFCVLGLGGGLLATYLHDTFPRCFVTALELDQEIANIAAEYFQCPVQSKRMNCIVADAMTFMEDHVKLQKCSKLPENVAAPILYDVMFVDLAGGFTTYDVVCPPAMFATREAFQLMKSCISPKGVLAVNLVSRNEEAKKRVRNCFSEVFKCVGCFTSKEDVNEVLFGTDLAGCESIQEGGGFDWKKFGHKNTYDAAPLNSSTTPSVDEIIRALS